MQMLEIRDDIKGVYHITSFDPELKPASYSELETSEATPRKQRSDSIPSDYELSDYEPDYLHYPEDFEPTKPEPIDVEQTQNVFVHDDKLFERFKRAIEPKRSRYDSLNIPQSNNGATELKGSFEFRLLDIMPSGSMSEDIVCELRVDTLGNDAPPYEALSYTWGDSSYFQYILLSGQRYQVSHNLWVALKYLRSSNTTRCIWVDALCINQADLHERAFMVSQMHTIYSKAQRTIAWIGESTSKSDIAVRFLQERLSRPFASCEMLDLHHLRMRTEENQPIQDSELEIWDALADFFGRAWYTRAWIVQEVACSQQWILKCGESDIKGHLLLGLFSGIFKAAYQISSALPMHILTMLEHARGLSWVGAPRPEELGILLSANRHRQAKEDKDKIYAFTNMLSSPIPELYPNYELPTIEIYYQAAKQIILRTRSLKILAECENERSYEGLTAVDGIPRSFHLYLPSWCPNWANRRITNGLWGGYSAATPLPFRATGDLEARIAFHGDTKRQSGGILTIQGMALDEVVSCGQDFYGKDVDLEAFFNDALNTINDRPYIKTKEDDEDSAVMCTLTLDRNVSGTTLYEDMLPTEQDPSFKRAAVGRKFFVTKNGFIGLGPYGLEEDDLVVLIPGCHVPIVLRKGVFMKEFCPEGCGACGAGRECEDTTCPKRYWSPEQHWDVIGEAYVHGVMNGEIDLKAREGSFFGFELNGGNGMVAGGAFPNKRNPPLLADEEGWGVEDGVLRY